MLADREYRIIDGVLRERCPELTTYLKTTRKRIGAKEVPAYAWIEIHGVGEVEQDHANKAFAALDKAGAYTRARPEAEVRRLSLQGYERFASLQRTFFAHVASECAQTTKAARA
jgi:hypothetical protein